MQVTTRVIQGESLGQIQQGDKFSPCKRGPKVHDYGLSIENLWMGGLNWKQRKVAKGLIQSKDACCERNFGCDGCYQMARCLREWDTKVVQR
ncbi:MAG: hypothetical protein WC455_15345 [Dehalococcoidia bacterium]|jgi:hypothetical protein